MSDQMQSSNAHNPDLDWSQVRETINMLTLAVAQIESSMKESEDAVSSLTETFTRVASKLNNLAESGKSLNDINAEEQASVISTIKDESNDINTEVSSAIVAFQFYDRLSQRLEHVKRNLLSLSGVISTPEQLYNPAAWKKLQTEITSNHSVEAERIMFEHILKGATIEQALEIYRHHFDKKTETESDIELF
ncbi:hypothetical protein [Alkalimarinus alittae]|uniref:Uncharacterized protein n=1 Tax=Alkalimarinus alittae TaxID=2961619 RepID=A0ABY6N6V4_9ALTE|nr:hypothetical protein [Alkalimarinus alittae]UZE97727.1 hypothetical protein NKI27_08340 [Alkalimarinus alittae]